MNNSKFLVDTSALTRMFSDKKVIEKWRRPVTKGLVAICAVTELEFLYTARSAKDRKVLLERIENSYPWVPMPDRSYEQAARVQEKLTKAGLHRCASAVDLLVAAAAELQGLILLHYDNDFEQVAKVTNQPTRWLARRGSLN